MIEKPGNRTGVDSYMVQRTAFNILQSLQDAGWNKGEAELLPGAIKEELRKNQKRLHESEPFLVNKLIRK